MLNLLEFYWGDMSVDWCGNANKQMNIEIEEIAMLMLRDFELRAEVNFQADYFSNKSAPNKVRYLLKKVFYSKERMAALFPARKDGIFIYFYYPVRWFEILSKKIKHIFSKAKVERDEILMIDPKLVNNLRERLK